MKKIILFCCLLASISLAAQTNDVVFSDQFTSDNWQLQVFSGAQASKQLSGGQLQISIAAKGSAVWHAQLITGGISLVQGKTYYISFDASSSVSQTMWVSCGMGVSPYSSYSGDLAVNLGTSVSHYTLSFTMTSATDAAARLNILLGLSSGTITIDNMSVYTPTSSSGGGGGTTTTPYPKLIPLKMVNPQVLIGATVTYGTDDQDGLFYGTYKDSVQSVMKREFGLGQTTCYPAWDTWTGLKQYDFTKFNACVNWLYNNNLKVCAHLLVGWDNYYPDWYKSATYSNSDMELMLEDYIKQAMTTNANNTKVTYWNVVNEAFDWDGKYYFSNNKSKWQQLGWEDDASGLTDADKVHTQHPVYVRKAFEYAKKYATANSKLELRDYNTDFWQVDKSRAFYQLARHLVNKGVPINAVGLQCHFDLALAYDWTLLTKNIEEYRKLGLEVYITELDIVDKTLSWDAAKAEKQRQYYKEAVAAAVKGGVTWICTWGIRDNFNKYWMYNMSPLLYDTKYNVKASRYGFQEGLAAAVPTTATQNISLAKGWNLISTNVSPTDSTIATLFKGLDVQEIKNMDAFWLKGQTTVFNGLQKITSGEGYLVNMNVAGTLFIQGVTLSHPLNVPNKTGWQLIGCPYQTATPLSTIFNTNNCSAIKNFDGFWMPSGANNSIQNMETGKGYFIKK